MVHNPKSPGFYSILLRPKLSREWRPILDLKLLNTLIVNQTFRMESARTIQQATVPNQWACSIDLTDAYFHVPIHPSFRKYLRFCINGQVYQFHALPFSLIIAPRIFTMIMLEIAKILRENMYLDDWLIRHCQREELSVVIWSILQLCVDLGLLANLTKSELDPEQRYKFVGVLYDLSVGRAYPPEKRVEKN